MADAWIAVGRVRTVNPRAREVRINVRDGYGYVFGGLAWIQFEQAQGDVLRCKVMAARSDETTSVVTLSPGVPRDTVGRLKGLRVLLAPGEIPPRPTGPSRLADWLGTRVMLPSGETLGTVCEVFEGPANDAFAVRRPDKSRCILPVIEAVVRRVDLEAGTIEVGDVEPFIVEV